MLYGKKIGLALSGGGYRAAAFHLGTLKALDRLGILPMVDVISSVSGGSIIAAFYLLHQDKGFPKFEHLFKEKLQCSSMKWVYVELAAIAFLLVFAGYYSFPILAILVIFLLVAFIFFSYYVIPINQLIELGYKQLFFGNSVVKDLPKHPLLAINATDTEFAKPFVFTRDRIIHSEYQPVDGKLIFNTSKVSLAKAVMASSCIPLFNPVCIDKKYQNINLGKSIYLMDGGLFDNEGLHRLVHSHGKSHAEYNIISNAGNTRWNSRGVESFFSSLYKGINIMMKRTQSLQNQQIIYDGNDGIHRFAFFELDWDNTDKAFWSFLKYLEQKTLPQELLDYHHLDRKDIEGVTSAINEIRELAEIRIVEKLKSNVEWESLNQRMPTEEERALALKVKTRLDGLSIEQIDALEKHSDWLTEFQIRLYLPELIQS